MKISDYLTKERIIFDLHANTKEKVLLEMADLFKNDIIIDGKKELFLQDLKERENTSSTGMQEGIAVPHTRSAAVSKLGIALAFSKTGLDFNSLDGEPSNIFFMIAAPEDTKTEHLELLSLISRLSFEDDLMKELMVTTNPDRVIEIVASV